MKSSVFKERRKNLADLILNNELYVPMKTKEIAILLGIPKELRHELQEVLDSLVADGTIGVSKKGKYMKPDNVALVGTFESTSRGFGFVVVDGQDDDIFVKASDTKDAFYHDKVKVVITAQKNGDRRREGKIIEILDHEVKTLVGTYQKNKNFGFVVPDNQKIGCDIFVSKEHEIGAVTGSKVVVKISSYGSARKNPEGKIIEVIGHMDDPGTDILSIVKAYDLPEEFPDSVKKELKGIPDEVDGNDIAGRTDLRDVVMVTIDGEDSKDLDDAVSLTKENDIYHLGVHIADDKAGIAEIMQAMCYLRDHDEIKHGDIRVGFNPDEEIGMGAHHFDVEKFGCQWAYTMDGGDLGELEFENFNAAGAKVFIKGVSVHTGYAKGKMINANRLACEFNSLIPETDIPETTEGYQGFYHLISMETRTEEAKMSYIIRDHDREKFEDRKQFFLDIANKMNAKYGEGTVSVKLNDQYYNMKEKIDDNMHVIDIVLRAMQETGVRPKVEPIRGGTDGAQLSFKGLPCPNIFAGGVNFHGPYEFVSIQVMQKAVDVIVKICEITGTYND